MRAQQAIQKLLPFPGVDALPKLCQESRFVENVENLLNGKIKACVFKRVYHVEIESFYESGNHDSWIVIRTGDRSTPEAAMKEWNRLVRRVRKG